MYTIKLKKGEQVQYFQCAHMSIKTVTPTCLAAREGLAEPGVTFELSNGVTVSLPKDGDAVFIINSDGITIDAHYWPPRPKAPRA